MPKVMVQKAPKGGRNCDRAGRLRSKTLAARPAHVMVARERHLKNARRSCGDPFARALAAYYRQVGNPGAKIK